MNCDELKVLMYSTLWYAVTLSTVWSLSYVINWNGIEFGYVKLVKEIVWFVWLIVLLSLLSYWKKKSTVEFNSFGGVIYTTIVSVEFSFIA